MTDINKLLIMLLLAAPLTLMAQSEDDATEAQDSTAVVKRVRKARKQEATREIKGRVLGYQGKTPLAGAMVQSVAGRGYSTLTEEDGTFVMNVPVYGTVVTVTIPGYNTIRVGLNKSGDLGDIIMQSDAAKPLYGDDDNIKNAVTASSMEFTPAVNAMDDIGNQLQGYLYSRSRSGVPGISSYVEMNGVTSLNGNTQPLIVLDGVPIDMQYGRTYLHDGFYSDVLTNINPNDVEYVRVISNGTSLYGAKGSNGVIEINTRRNKTMATRIEASANVGVELIPETYGMMNAVQFKNYAAGLIGTMGTKVKNFRFLQPYLKNSIANANFNKYQNDTDWGDEVYRNAVTHRYALSVSGGGDVANYMLSVGYTRANSTLKENNLDRLNIRFNTDVKIANIASVRFDAAYTNQTRELFDIGTPASYSDRPVTSLNFLASAKTPMLSPYGFVTDANGGYINRKHLNVLDEDYMNDVSAMNSQKADWRLANPSAILEYGYGEHKNYYDNGFFTLGVTPRVDINKNLFVSSMFSFHLINTNEKYYVPMNGVPSYWVSNSNRVMDNEIRSLFGKQNNLMSDTKVDWHDNFGAHDIHVMGGFRFLKQDYKYNSNLAYNTGSDKTPQPNSGIGRSSLGGEETRTSLNWYAQAEYNYANRYYLTGEMSMETNSEFGRATKSGFQMCGVSWGLFPSLQAGWVMSNEKWFNVKGINYLKLTAGYSLTGNDDLPYGARRTYYSPYLVNSTLASLKLGNVGNDELQWETTRRMNFGLQVNAIDNRLAFSFNYFKGWTSNLLMEQELGFASGMDRVWRNAASLTNEGFNVGIMGHLYSSNDWNWTANLTVGHYVNTVTEIDNTAGYIDTDVYGGVVRTQVGRDANSFYGYKTVANADGNIVYATTAEANAAGLNGKALYIEDNTGKKTYFQAGDVHYADLNGDGKIDDNDKTFIGCATPDIYGTFSTALSWKGLKLDVNFKYSLGGDIYNFARQQLECGSRFQNQTTAMLGRWITEGQKTDIPRASYGDPMGNSDFSDRWIEDGSYLKLKTVTISYKLPINSIAIQGITVWAQACNLFTITKYLGMDPEFSASNAALFQSVDKGLLSAGRSFNLGVKINL